MSSLVTLSRIPGLGLNSEYRLRASYAQQPDEEACFIESREALEAMMGSNVCAIAGCIPGVSLIAGVFRLYVVYSAYQASLETAEAKQALSEHSQASEEERVVAAAWLQDRKWTLIEMGVLGVAEICQLSIILAAAHLVKTIVDHIVASQHQPAVDSRIYNDFQWYIQTMDV